MRCFSGQRDGGANPAGAIGHGGGTNRLPTYYSVAAAAARRRADAEAGVPATGSSLLAVAIVRTSAASPVLSPRPCN